MIPSSSRLFPIKYSFAPCVFRVIQLFVFVHDFSLYFLCYATHFIISYLEKTLCFPLK